MSTKTFDFIIAGGGIVGLAAAHYLLEKNSKARVLVIEKEEAPAMHQTGHNSGVIHSGIYYKPGSLKAKNCIEGYHLLIDFCTKHEIPFELCGKIIVATQQNELDALKTVYERGIENGLEGLRYLEPNDIKAIEPFAAGIKGIWVPQTGIVDYKEVAKKYASEIVRLGGQINYNEKVTALIDHTDEVSVKTSKLSYKAGKFINCAGLFSDKIALMQIPELKVRIIPFRGEYYELKSDKRYMVKNLIYPVPDPSFPFLGVHFTRRLDGMIEAGPNAVFAFKREGYKKTDFSLSDVWNAISWKGFRLVAIKYWRTGLGEFYRSYSKSAFTRALQKLMPSLQKSDLIASGSGVRAQACELNGGLLDDFYIIQQGACIHVLNAPSPAATSSLAIGKKIAALANNEIISLSE